MVPRVHTQREVIELLARAAEQAQHAETYHAAAADPSAVDGRAAQQAACDAAAMQLIELAGCAEEFKRGWGDPGTTLARLDDVLRSVVDMRTAHTHPESGTTPPQPITPRRFGQTMEQLKAALGNLDNESRKVLPWSQGDALNKMAAGLAQIEKDGRPDPGALRSRDLHYAGYYREIQFGRLAKETGRYDNWGKAADARELDINASIFAIDDMAHKFHEMRKGADKSILPPSAVSPNRSKAVPDRSLSELVRELRRDLQSPAERLNELAAREREQYRDAVRGLAQTFADITGDPTAAALIHDYLQQKEPKLDRAAITSMREALRIAATPATNYLALPETVRDSCMELSIGLAEERRDSRLIRILDVADARGQARAASPGPADEPQRTIIEEPALDRDGGPKRSR